MKIGKDPMFHQKTIERVVQAHRVPEDGLVDSPEQRNSVKHRNFELARTFSNRSADLVRPQCHRIHIDRRPANDDGQPV